MGKHSKLYISKRPLESFYCDVSLLFIIVILSCLDTEVYKQVIMNYLLRLIMMGLLVVACTWGIQSAALEDTEILPPSLPTAQELDLKTEVLIEQPEIHASKIARAILDHVSYLQASITEEVDKNVTKPVLQLINPTTPLHELSTGSNDSSSSPSEEDPQRPQDRPLSISDIYFITIFGTTLCILGILAIIYLCTPCGSYSDDYFPSDEKFSTKPHGKHYSREAPFVLRSGHYKV
jgi:hypothetical protein